MIRPYPICDTEILVFDLWKGEDPVVVCARDGDISVWAIEANEGDWDILKPVHEFKDDDSFYWWGCLMYHYYHDDTVNWNGDDYWRASQVCHKLQVVPGPRLLEEMIGYKPEHLSQPDPWHVVSHRVDTYKKLESPYRDR